MARRIHKDYRFTPLRMSHDYRGRSRVEDYFIAAGNAYKTFCVWHNLCVGDDVLTRSVSLDYENREDAQAELERVVLLVKLNNVKPGGRAGSPALKSVPRRDYNGTILGEYFYVDFGHAYKTFCVWQRVCGQAGKLVSVSIDFAEVAEAQLELDRIAWLLGLREDKRCVRGVNGAGQAVKRK